MLALSSGAWKRYHIAEYAYWLVAERGVLTLGPIMTGDVDDRFVQRAQAEKQSRKFIREKTMFTRLNYYFFRSIWRLRTVFLMLLALLAAGAAAVTLFEKMPFADALYFALVTGLTIGYGDVVANTPLGRLVAILIGFIGILFTGLMIAVLVFAVRESLSELRKRG
jgi:voltage-gated potassium channel